MSVTISADCIGSLNAALMNITKCAEVILPREETPTASLLHLSEQCRQLQALIAAELVRRS